jgi:hypothetical protein
LWTLLALTEAIRPAAKKAAAETILSEDLVARCVVC